ncbi:MAG: hypothetical protein HRU32_12785 [Rhodobacteraceae bacterium]|nr:hypothetical protein [Paracoccaceae bacterium]
MTRLFAAVTAVFFAAPLAAQESVTLAELPLLGSDGSSLCGYIDAQTQSPLDTATRTALESELRRRGGFNGNDIRVLLRSDADVGFGMTLQGLQCALGGEVEVVYRRSYGGTQTWQVRLFDHFERYNIGHAYLEGNGTASGMRVRSLI